MYNVATLYVCSLYWALSIMTNLKGNPAHESRQCFWTDPLVVRPLEERIVAIVTFVCGATFYSIIYGNIGQFVGNIYQAGMRYRKRVEQINEFSKFHSLSPVLMDNIHKYVSFSFAVTNGLNADAIAAQLPPHLQLDVYMELYCGMVQQVGIFKNCPDNFHRAIVMKLQNSICTAGDYVFYEGEMGERMYFIKYGTLRVLVSNVEVHTFVNSGYFGEIALLIDSPRTADIRAVTNCLLLSLSSSDLGLIFDNYPGVQELILEQSKERLAELEQKKNSEPPLLQQRMPLAGETVVERGSPMPSAFPLTMDAVSPSPFPTRCCNSPLSKKTAHAIRGGKIEPEPHQDAAHSHSPDDSFSRGRRQSLDTASGMVGPKATKRPSLKHAAAERPERRASSEKKRGSPSDADGSKRAPSARAVPSTHQECAVAFGACGDFAQVSDETRKAALSIEGARKRTTLHVLGRGDRLSHSERDDSYDLPIQPLRDNDGAASVAAGGGAGGRRHSAVRLSSDQAASVAALISALDEDRRQRSLQDEKVSMVLQDLVSQINALSRQLSESLRTNGW